MRNREEKMEAYVFPGQGSQQPGMGRDLFDSAEYRELEAEADSIVGYSLRDLCVNDSGRKLKETQYTQPALYTVNFLHFLKTVNGHARPDFVAGHSLGEFNALLAAGAFDFLTGLRIVAMRGKLMAQAKEGGMAAIVGPSASEVEQILKRDGLSGLDIANHNSPTQTVISGPVADIARAEKSFRGPAVRLFTTLPVSAAFHSRYMRDAADAFRSFLGKFEFRALKLPVIANTTSRPYPSEDPSQTIKTVLADQVVNPVQWCESIRYLKSRGVTKFIEVGPGNVLNRLIAQIPS
jgi:malonyl CoA-acyl carrier protein transacylase